MKHFFIFIIFLFSTRLTAQWNPNAGVISAHTEGATVSVSSNNANTNNILDLNDNTAWQSGAPLPGGYISRPDLNIFLGRGSVICSGSGSSVNYTNVTDANTNTQTPIPAVNNSSFLQMTVENPSTLVCLNTKLTMLSGVTVAIHAFTSPTDSVQIGTFTNANNYATLRFNFPQNQVITHIKMRSTGGSFGVFEAACLAAPPKEFVIVNFGSVKSVGYIETRMWTGSNAATSTALYYSVDSINWIFIKTLNPNALQRVCVTLPSVVQAKYIKLEHTLNTNDYTKVYVWEIAAWGENGWMGTKPAPVQSPQTLGNMLGVNGIWGWGTNAYSSATDNGTGPWLFNKVATQGRNYHNLGWDVTDPDNTPNYATMAAGGGTQAQNWLNWNTEYVGWKNAGLNTGVSIQFTADDFPPSVWNTPYQSAYNYGAAFAQHFGPIIGNNNVKTLEVGNEPWDYDSIFYRNVLRGMAQGAKTANPNIEVFPCALQSAFPQAENSGYKNFTGARITAQEAPFLDGLNSHLYCFKNDDNGVRRSIHPEAPYSSFWTVLADIRFRNTNMPNKKIYVTEYGWDSDGGGDGCTHSECVTEKAQAVYGVRGAMLLARLGIDRFHWYFYDNTSTGTLFARSGMFSTSKQKKRSYTAFQALKTLLGDRYFLGIEREDTAAYIYKFGDADGTVSHYVAWRPDVADSNTTTYVQFSAPAAPFRAWAVGGQSSYGELLAIPTYTAGNIALTLTTTPTVIKINQGGGTVPCNLTADFTPLSTACQTVTFQNISTSECAAGNLKFSWDFGTNKNINTTGHSPVVKFIAPNTYNVCMSATCTVNNVVCNEQTICKAVAVTTECNFTPDFTFAENNCGEVIFNGSTTGTTCNEEEWTYIWRFGDSTSALSGSNVSHAFANAGTYNVCLEVSRMGCTKQTICKTVVVTNQNTACNCDITITQSGIYRPSSLGTGSFYLNVQPGQTICVQGGNYGMLRFIGFEGTKTAPIRIRNHNGQVRVGHNAYYAAIDLQNCRYMRLTGTGDAAHTYGFKIDSCGTASAISLGSRSSDIEFDHVEVVKAGFAGIMAKTDPNCTDTMTWYKNYVMNNVNIHHNYFHDVGGEGLYVGNSFYSGWTTTCSGTSTLLYPHIINGLDIHHNIVKRSNAEGLQYACAPNAQVHDNYIDSTGLDPFASFQNNGLQCGGGAGGNCYNNIIKNTAAAGIIVIGQFGNNKFYNNLMVNTNGIFCDDRSGSIPNTSVDFTNNTFIKVKSIPFTLYNEINTNSITNNAIVGLNSTNIVGYPQGATASVSNNYFTTNPAAMRFEDTTNGNYRPLANSPLVDAGRNITPLSITHDLDYAPRLSGTNYDIGAYEYQSATLPLDLWTFSGSQRDNDNLLFWEIAPQQKGRFFIVERSENGQLFAEISIIPFENKTKYRFTDENAALKTHYYRLKIMENDGTTSYSKIIVLAAKTHKNMRLYPNPTNNTVFIENAPENAPFQIVNIFGQVVISGNNLPNEIDLSTLAAGLYCLKIENQILQIVKQ